MTRDVAKIVGLAASGAAPEWDIMVVTDAHHGSLWTKGTRAHKFAQGRELVFMKQDKAQLATSSRENTVRFLALIDRSQ